MSSSLIWVVIWGLSLAGRASALQAEGHRFEPYRPHIFFYITCRSGGTGRRPGLKIPWVVIPVPVRFRSAALDFNLCFLGTEVFCCIFSRNKSAAGTQIRSFSAFSFYIRLFRNLSGRSCDTQIFRIPVIRRRKKGMGISLYFLCRGYQTAGADISLHLAHNHLFVSPLLFQSNGSTVSY